MKLNVDQAMMVITLHKAGWTQEAIAARYGVRHQQVGRIIRGEQWADKIKRAQDKAAHKKLLDLMSKCGNIGSAIER